MDKMNALEFYKSHESAPLPDVGDLVSLTVEELCELMEQYHQSKVNNGVLDDVISRFFKDPIDICVIPEVYKTMIDYRNEHSENQQRQLAVSCKVIKTILLNSINGL